MPPISQADILHTTSAAGEPARVARVVAVYFAFSAVVLAPFLSVGIPGLGDTLNHLARMHILATIGRSPELQRFYEVHWTPIPYLAMDAVVPLLARIMPVYAAGKLFVAACVLLPVGGTAALHFAVHRRASLVPCAAFLVSTNALLSFGFLNFLFTAGLALLLFAGWIAAADWSRWVRAALFAPGVLVLYFGHAFGCAAYCLAVAGFELASAMRSGFRPRLAVAADLGAAFAQAVPALCFAATLDVGSGYVGKLNTEYGTAGDKLAALFSPFEFLHDEFQGAVLLAAVLLAAVLSPRLRLANSLWPAALVLALAACAVPHVLSSTWGTDLRLPLVTVLILIACVRVRAGPVLRRAMLASLFVLTGVKSADAWLAMHRADAEFTDTRHVLSRLPAGARLLVVSLNGHGSGHEQIPINTLWHLPLTAVIDRDAFVPTLFTGLTTVRVRPEYRLSSTPNGLPISPAQLREGMAQGDDGTAHGDGLGARYYHFGWPEKFDYVLVQRLGGDPGQLPENLAPVASSGGMDLYRVIAPTNGASPAGPPP